MLDTAALYGGGGNEYLVRKAVGHRRAEYRLATKGVLELHRGQRVLDGSPGALAGMIDRSLQRLDTDHVDLYYLHRLDPAVPIEESVGALSRAREAGKIGAIGLSEMSAATIRRAHAEHPIAAVQSEYSLLVRNPEVGVLDACRSLGIGFVSFSPVARGLLAGSIRSATFTEGDIRRAMPRFVEPNLAHNLLAIAKFDATAHELGFTPAQVALAWILQREEISVAIPGTRSIKHLDENLAAASIRLDDETLRQVENVFLGDAIRGARYARAAQAQIDTELLPDEELA